MNCNGCIGSIVRLSEVSTPLQIVIQINYRNFFREVLVLPSLKSTGRGLDMLKGGPLERQKRNLRVVIDVLNEFLAPLVDGNEAPVVGIEFKDQAELAAILVNLNLKRRLVYHPVSLPTLDSPCGCIVHS